MHDKLPAACGDLLLSVNAIGNHPVSSVPTGGGGDSRALEIEIRRLNSELKSLKSSKQEQESSLRAQNDRIHKLTAKCVLVSSPAPSLASYFLGSTR